MADNNNGLDAYDYVSGNDSTTVGDLANKMRYPDEAHAAPAGDNEPVKPQVVLMGLKKSGKSSIVQVVFHKMSPNETLYLESTRKVQRSGVDSNSLVQLEVCDYPGQIDYFDEHYDSEQIFGNCGAVVFVIDAQQEDCKEALDKLHHTIVRAHAVNPRINFEVFIHKVDTLSNDSMIDRRDYIMHQCNSELVDANVGVHPSFYTTSIYDHSIFEAFSKVVQKLLPQLVALEGLLDIVQSSCRLEKAFLFDIVSKLYIASDSSPVDMLSYELCSDMIDVVVDVSCIYGASSDANPLAYDEHSRAIIRLSNKMVLYLVEMTKYLALVCIMREENFEKHGILEYNFQTLKDIIARVFRKPPQKQRSSRRKTDSKA